MISMSFVATVPLFLAAIVIFGCGIARNNAKACTRTMSIGLAIGLVGVIIAAVLFVFFSL